MKLLPWKALTNERPDLAEWGRDLLYRSGTGLAFLATITKDGAPRINPVAPVLVVDGLYVVLAGGPKCADLLRDGRFALHSCPHPDNEDAFSIKGRAEQVVDPVTLDLVETTFWHERGRDGRPDNGRDQTLFELKLSSCLLTRTAGHLDSAPQKTIWRAGG